MPQNTLIFAGRHPLLTAAEWFSRHPDLAAQLDSVGTEGWLVRQPDSNSTPDNLSEYGGVIKLAELVAEASAISDAAAWWCTTIARFLQELPPGRVTFSLNYQGSDVAPDLDHLCYVIKQATAGRSLRFLLPKSGEPQLSSAQIIHHRLLPPDGYDFTLLQKDDWCGVGLTTQVQDIDSYRKRDEGRPYRADDRGMMPLKLCQTLINLTGVSRQDNTDIVLLDPFCGSGSILQEAWLRHFQVIGSDLNPQAIAESEANLNWLAQHYKRPAEGWSLLSHDVRRIDQVMPPESVDCVVSEGYLGKLFSHMPTEAEIRKQNRELIPLYRDGLRALAKLLKPGAPVVLCLPYYLGEAQSLLPELLDAIRGIPYNYQSLLPEHFTESNSAGGIDPNPRGSYIYSRPGQIIGREIFRLNKDS